MKMLHSEVHLGTRPLSLTDLAKSKNKEDLRLVIVVLANIYIYSLLPPLAEIVK